MTDKMIMYRPAAVKGLKYMCNVKISIFIKFDLQWLWMIFLRLSHINYVINNDKIMQYNWWLKSKKIPKQIFNQPYVYNS